MYRRISFPILLPNSFQNSNVPPVMPIIGLICVLPFQVMWLQSPSFCSNPLTLLLGGSF